MKPVSMLQQAIKFYCLLLAVFQTLYKSVSYILTLTPPLLSDVSVYYNTKMHYNKKSNNSKPPNKKKKQN